MKVLPLHKKTKMAAHYRISTVPERNRGETCHECKYMNKDGTCDRVKGTVKPLNVCDLYERR